MISDEDVAGLTMEAGETFHAGFVLGFLDNEAGINRQTLITNSGTTGVGFPTSCLGKFGGITDRTMLALERGSRERRNTNSVLKDLRYATEV